MSAAARSTVAGVAAALLLGASAAPASAARPSAPLPQVPVAGAAFTVASSNLTAGSTYRVVLRVAGAAGTTDVSESNSCRSAAAATSGRLTCTMVEATPGSYEVLVLSLSGTVVTTTPLTVAEPVTYLPPPTVVDAGGVGGDSITLHPSEGIDSYTIQGKDYVLSGPAMPAQTIPIAPGPGPSTDVDVVVTTKAGFAFEDGSTRRTWTLRTTAADPAPDPLVVPEPEAVDPPSTGRDAVRVSAAGEVSWRVGDAPVPTGSGSTVDVPVTGARDARGSVVVPVTATAPVGFTFGDGAITKTVELTFTDEPPVVALAGADRFATSAAVSRKFFTGTGGTVFITGGTDLADASAAGPAAARVGSPLLLTGRSAVPPAVWGEVRRLDPKRIVVVGGEAVVSRAVVTQLEKIAPVERVAGGDRYVTAARLAARFGPRPVVYLSSGSDFADGVSGGSGAAREGAPMVFSAPTSLPASTRAALVAAAPSKVVVTGGVAAVSPAVLSQVRRALPHASIVRVGGPDRYATAALVAESVTAKPWGKDGAAPTQAILASGETFADALVGVPAAYRAKAPLLLTRPGCVPLAVKTRLDALPLTSTVRLGGAATRVNIRAGACR